MLTVTGHSFKIEDGRVLIHGVGRLEGFPLRIGRHSQSAQWFLILHFVSFLLKCSEYHRMVIKYMVLINTHSVKSIMCVSIYTYMAANTVISLILSSSNLKQFTIRSLLIIIINNEFTICFHRKNNFLLLFVYINYKIKTHTTIHSHSKFNENWKSWTKNPQMSSMRAGCGLCYAHNFFPFSLNCHKASGCADALVTLNFLI